MEGEGSHNCFSPVAMASFLFAFFSHGNNISFLFSFVHSATVITVGKYFVKIVQPNQCLETTQTDHILCATTVLLY